MKPEAIPSTYVPGRNTVFIAIGLSLAEAKGAQRLVLGVNAGYLGTLIAALITSTPFKL